MSIPLRKLKAAVQLPTKLGNVQLYLVHFPDNNFYKVGVTSKKLADRFSNYPKFTKIQCWVMKLDKALEIELDVINTFHNYTPRHWKFNRPGKTECFKTGDISKVQQFIAARLNTKMVNFFISQAGVSSLDTCEGVQVFKRNLPIEQANYLLKLTEDTSDPIEAVFKCLNYIKYV